MPGDAKSAPPASSDASARRSLKLAPRKPAAKRDRGCPEEMQRVADFCVDRWEVRTETLNGEPLSPFYPPDFRILNKIRKVWMLERPRVGPERARALPLPPLPVWQRQRFKVRAVSQPGVIPQGYMSYYMAKRACAAAGKRLCSDDEWQLACEGQGKTKFPYGPDYVAGRCNVFREFHPADVLHLGASSGHRDPRLNLVLENGNDPGLRDTGATKSCVSEWSGGGIYDMVGNLDEWVEDPRGRFRGGSTPATPAPGARPRWRATQRVTSTTRRVRAVAPTRARDARPSAPRSGFASAPQQVLQALQREVQLGDDGHARLRLERSVLPSVGIRLRLRVHLPGAPHQGDDALIGGER